MFSNQERQINPDQLDERPKLNTISPDQLDEIYESIDKNSLRTGNDNYVTKVNHDYQCTVSDGIGVVERQGNRTSEEDAFGYTELDSKINDFSSQQLIQISKQAFHNTNKELKKQKFALSEGCCVESNIITKDKIITTHLGDSRSYLVHISEDKKTITITRLTTDHSPDNEKELQRIKDAGGIVAPKTRDIEGPNRVNGVLTVSRALGLLNFKRQKSDHPQPLQSTQPLISEEPDIKITTIPEKGTSFLVMACDGLTEKLHSKRKNPPVLSDLDIAKMVFETQQKTAVAIARNLVETALDNGSNDNVTCCVVKLNKRKNANPCVVESIDGMSGPKTAQYVRKNLSIELNNAVNNVIQEPEEEVEDIIGLTTSSTASTSTSTTSSSDDERKNSLKRSDPGVGESNSNPSQPPTNKDDIRGSESTSDTTNAQPSEEIDLDNLLLTEAEQNLFVYYHLYFPKEYMKGYDQYLKYGKTKEFVNAIKEEQTAFINSLKAKKQEPMEEERIIEKQKNDNPDGHLIDAQESIPDQSDVKPINTRQAYLRIKILKLANQCIYPDEKQSLNFATQANQEIEKYFNDHANELFSLVDSVLQKKEERVTNDLLAIFECLGQDPNPLFNVVSCYQGGYNYEDATQDLLTLLTLRNKDGSKIVMDDQTKLQMYSGLQKFPELNILVKKCHAYVEGQQILENIHLAEKMKDQPLIVSRDSSGKVIASNKPNYKPYADYIEDFRIHCNKNGALLREDRESPLTTFMKVFMATFVTIIAVATVVVPLAVLCSEKATAALSNGWGIFKPSSQKTLENIMEMLPKENESSERNDNKPKGPKN